MMTVYYTSTMFFINPEFLIVYLENFCDDINKLKIVKNDSLNAFAIVYSVYSQVLTFHN